MREYLTLYETKHGPAMITLSISSTRVARLVTFSYVLRNVGLTNLNSEFFIQSELFGKIDLGRHLLFTDSEMNAVRTFEIPEAQERVRERARGFCKINDRLFLESTLEETLEIIHYPTAILRPFSPATTSTVFTVTLAICLSGQVPRWTNWYLYMKVSVIMAITGMSPVTDSDNLWLGPVEILDDRTARVAMRDADPGKYELRLSVDFTIPSGYPNRTRNFCYWVESEDFYVSRLFRPWQRSFV